MPNFAVEPWAVRETALDLEALAQAESVFALSNGHLGLRANLDEGEPFGLPGTYLNSFYELRPLPYAEAGYGYPESGQTIVNVTNGKIIRLLVDDEPLDVRYGQLLAHERELDLRAGVLRRRVEWRSPAGTAVRVQLDAARLVRAALRRSDPLRGRAARGAAARGRPVRARGQRARARRARPIRAPPRRSSRRCVSDEFFDHDAARGARPTRPAAASSRWRRGWITWSTGRRGRTPRRRAAADLARVTVAADLAPGRAPEDREVPRLRVVEQALASGASRRGRGGAGRGAAHRLGRARRRAARLPRRLLGARRRRARRRHRASAGRALRALPHAPGGRPRRAARDPRQGPDGPWLRRAHVLGQRALHPARAHVHGSERGRRRAALAARHARPRARAREPARPRRRRVSVAHDPRPGVLGLLARRHGGVPHQRRHRRRRDPVPVRDRRRGVRARGRPRAARRDRPAVAIARASRRRRGASASTASPAPTSTARSPTTTSTRTCSPSGTCAPLPTRSRVIPATRQRSEPTSEEAAAWRDAAAATW